MKWLDKLLGRKAPAEDAHQFDIAAAGVDELVLESQRLAREQDAIKARRRALADAIDAKLTGK